MAKLEQRQTRNLILLGKIRHLMLMYTFMLTLKTPSGENSECGTKEVNIKVSRDFILTIAFSKNIVISLTIFYAWLVLSIHFLNKLKP